MSEGGYKIRNQAAIHFITFATVEWVDLPAGRQVCLQESNTGTLYWIASGFARQKKGFYYIAGV
jgi:hypothetical protein